MLRAMISLRKKTKPKKPPRGQRTSRQSPAPATRAPGLGEGDHPDSLAGDAWHHRGERRNWPLHIILKKALSIAAFETFERGKPLPKAMK